VSKVEVGHKTEIKAVLEQRTLKPRVRFFSADTQSKLNRFRMCGMRTGVGHADQACGFEPVFAALLGAQLRFIMFYVGPVRLDGGTFSGRWLWRKLIPKRGRGC